MPSSSTCSGRRSAPSRTWALLLTVLAASALGGCASENDDLVRRLDQLQGELREVRGTGLATQDRLDSVERQLAAMREKAAQQAAQNPTDRPSLPVVRLGPVQPPEGLEPAAPSDATATPEPPDDGRRPVLRGDGSGARIETGPDAKGGSSRGRHGSAWRSGAGAGPASATLMATGGR